MAMGVLAPAASSIHGITSSQVEASCSFLPPRKPRGCDWSASQPYFEARQPQIQARPCLNVEDVPEMQLVKVRCTKLFGRRVSKKVVWGVRKQTTPQGARVPEDDIFSDNEVDEDVSETRESTEEKACTYQNAGAWRQSGWRPFHEICETSPACVPAAEESGSLANAQQEAPRLVSSVTWPSLRSQCQSRDTSWAVCDASSMASSWVDMTAEQKLAEDGEEWTLVGGSAAAPEMSAVQIVSAPSGSWAAKLAGSAQAPTPRLPASRPAMRLKAKSARERRHPPKVLEEENGEDCVLDNLESRRMCPGNARGKTQRLRAGRRGG